MVAADNANDAPVKKRKRVSRAQLSRKIWEEAEEAVRAVAICRGWPHESYEDLYETVRRLGKENPEQRDDLIAGFGGACSLYRDNLLHPFMDIDEIRAFRPAVKDFIKRLESL